MSSFLEAKEKGSNVAPASAIQDEATASGVLYTHSEKCNGKCNGNLQLPAVSCRRNFKMKRKIPENVFVRILNARISEPRTEVSYFHRKRNMTEHVFGHKLCARVRV